MRRIGAVFFWFGGVLTTSIPDLMARQLFALPIEKVDMATRLRMRQLEADLSVGRITAQQFCQSLIHENGVSLAAEGLEARVKQTIHLRSDVLAEVEALPSDVERWIICDYPRDWYEAAVNGSRLSANIAADRVVFTAECRLTRLIPDMFYKIVHCAGHSMDTCLMIDAVTPRSVEAIKHGLHAAIYVDAWRLKREFILRRMVPPPPGFVYPGPSTG
jgi:hypothetical protein